MVKSEMSDSSPTGRVRGQTWYFTNRRRGFTSPLVCALWDGGVGLTCACVLLQRATSSPGYLRGRLPVSMLSSANNIHDTLFKWLSYLLGKIKKESWIGTWETLRNSAKKAKKRLSKVGESMRLGGAGMARMSGPSVRGVKFRQRVGSYASARSITLLNMYSPAQIQLS